MPGDMAPVLRRRMHGPADQARTVTIIKQAGNLPVGHYPSGRDLQNKMINLLKDALELLPTAIARITALGRLRCRFAALYPDTFFCCRFFADRFRCFLAHRGRGVSAS